jgi:hypothetical protein
MLFETGPFAGYQLTLTGGDGVGAPGPREEMWIGGVLSLYAQNTSDPAPSVPFHLALVHNPTDGLDHLYVNGADSNDGFGGPDAGSARPATGKPLVWQGFLGTLGEVAVYETALTDTQIANHYRAGQ